MTTEPSTRSSDADEVTTARMVIGGELVDAAEGRTFDVVNPATGRVIATAPLGGKPDVDRAVDAARRAFDDPKGWATWPATKRGRTLAKFAQLIGSTRRSSRSSRRATSASRSAARPARSSARRFVFDYYAGRGEQALRRDDPGVEARPRLHAPRAHRGRRAHRPVELPAADGLVEAGPGARGGQHRDPQAGLAAHRSPRCASGSWRSRRASRRASST